MSAVSLFLWCVVVSSSCAQPLETGNSQRKDASGFGEAEFDVTLYKSADKNSYYVNPAELPEYEEQFNRIRSLGNDVQCKLTGLCPGKKRENIIAKTHAEKVQVDKGKKKSFDTMLEDESKGAEGQIGGQLPGENPMQRQFMQMGSVTSPMFSNAQGMKVDKLNGKYTQQPHAAEFGQQPQMDIAMPFEKQATNSQEQSEFSAMPSPVAGLTPDTLPGGMPGILAGGPGQMPEGGQGGMPNGFPGGMPGSMAENKMSSNMQRENNAPPSSEEEASRFQSQQMDDTIQQSIAHRLNFMATANNGIGQQQQQQQQSMFKAPEDPQMNRNNDEDPYNDMNNRDDVERAYHQKKSEAGDDKNESVTEDEILKVEDVQPGELDELHKFLKMSRNRVHVINSKNTEENNNGVKFVSNAEESKDYDDGNNEEDERDFNKESSMQREDGNENGDNGRPSDEFSRARDDGERNFEAERFRGMKETGRGFPEVPTMNNFFDGPMQKDYPSPDFVEESAKMAMQSNSDYQVPSSAFSNLWKSFLLTTQSQLGEADPSANSRGGIDKPHSHSKAKAAKETTKTAKDPEVRRWKKSDVGKVQSLQSKNGKKVTEKPSFMYIPLYVVKNLLAQAKKTSKGTPENVNTSNGVLKSGSQKSRIFSKKPPFYITIKHGKRYLVVNPDSELLQKYLDSENTARPDESHEYLPENIPEHSPMYYDNDRPNNADVLRNQQTHEYEEYQNGERKGESPKTISQPPSVPTTVNGYPVLQGDLSRDGVYKGFVAVPFITHMDPDSRGEMLENNNYNAYQNQQYFPLENNDYQRYPFPGNHRTMETQYFPDTRNQMAEDYFERISANQATVPENFYRDPMYDPNESDTFFNDQLNQGNTFRSQKIKRIENEEIANALQLTHLRAVTNQGQFDTSVSSERANEEPVNGFQEYAAKRDKSVNRRSEQPFVYTKEHVGFGPITVEAKTANAATSDDSDDN